MVDQSAEGAGNSISQGKPSRSGELVSIGLPVYNGDRYLAEAIESILAQTHDNIELIICDNASTDRTQEICERFRQRDQRVRYVRNQKNIGGNGNFRKTFELSRGRYFKWASHDDNLAPDFVASCLAALEKDSEVVLSLPPIVYIDQDGRQTAEQDVPDVSIEGSRYLDRIRRFFDLQVASDDIVYAIFGVIRADVLRQLDVWEPYVSSEEILMLDLLQYGKLRQIPESRFYFRLHPESGFQKYRKPKDRARWFDPSRKVVAVFPSWFLLRKYFGRILSGPFTMAEKVEGVSLVLYRAIRLWRRYVGDIAKFLLQFVR